MLRRTHVDFPGADQTVSCRFPGWIGRALDAELLDAVTLAWLGGYTADKLIMSGVRLRLSRLIPESDAHTEDPPVHFSLSVLENDVTRHWLEIALDSYASGENETGSGSSSLCRAILDALPPGTPGFEPPPLGTKRSTLRALARYAAKRASTDE